MKKFISLLILVSISFNFTGNAFAIDKTTASLIEMVANDCGIPTSLAGYIMDKSKDIAKKQGINAGIALAQNTLQDKKAVEKILKHLNFTSTVKLLDNTNKIFSCTISIQTALLMMGAKKFDSQNELLMNISNKYSVIMLNLKQEEFIYTRLVQHNFKNKIDLNKVNGNLRSYYNWRCDILPSSLAYQYDNIISFLPSVHELVMVGFFNANSINNQKNIDLQNLQNSCGEFNSNLLYYKPITQKDKNDMLKTLQKLPKTYVISKSVLQDALRNIK